MGVALSRSSACCICNEMQLIVNANHDSGFGAIQSTWPEASLRSGMHWLSPKDHTCTFVSYLICFGGLS